MSVLVKKKVRVATKVALEATRVLLNVSEDIPYFGKVAKLITKLIQVCDQCKCNKEASQSLQERFCRLADHLFSGPTGLAEIIKTRPNSISLSVFCGKMGTILEEGLFELERFAKGGFIMSILKGSKPQETFESLDKDMTQCLNDLSVALMTAQLADQAQTYSVVCNIQAKVDERGGLNGLMTDSAHLESLAQEIGADVDDLKADVMYVLASLGAQVGVVDENVREMNANVMAVHQAVMMMQKAAAAPDKTSLQLTSHPVVDRTLVLGEGAFGKVYKGVYNHIEVAVKEVRVSAAQEKEFLREVAMHHKVGNLPGVVRIFGAIFTTQPHSIVLELAAGTLHDALYKGVPSIDKTLSSKLSILVQVCSTMAEMSKMGILHRDLKSSNVLLFFNNARVYAKISDFGLTKMVNESTVSHTGATPKGTLPYMAPELFNGQYSSASDMYAFAVLLNEVLTEQIPFPGRSYVQIVQSVGTFRHRPDLFQPDLQDTIGCKLLSCITRAWNQDPALRVSFHELAGDLDHLFRRAAEAIREGKGTSMLEPHPLPTEEIEASILALAGWLNSICRLAEKDAQPLAHALVTVKHVHTLHDLGKLLRRTPEFLAKEFRVSVIHEANICAALGILSRPSSALPLKGRSSSTSCVELKSLKSAQLCELFDHCYIYDLEEVIHKNKLNGMKLEKGVGSIEDLVNLGMSAIDATVVYKHITEWKQKGLPKDFRPSSVLPSLASATAVTTPSEIYGSSALPSIVSNIKSSSAPTVTAATLSLPAINQLASVDPTVAKELDVDFHNAWYCGSEAATERIKSDAHCGNHLAEAYLSLLYYYGCRFLDKDKACASSFAAKADSWLLHYSRNGDQYALFNVAMMLLNGLGRDKSERDAVSYFHLAANQGHAAARCALGNFCYSKGIGVIKNEQEAVKYYKLAADQGNAKAQYRLGVCYAGGTGVTKNKKEAVNYHKLAADQGYAEAQFSLGACYASGIGVTKNEQEAVKYYKLAAEQGDVDAQFILGICYYYGTGVTKTELEAVKYYKLAADQDHAEAQYRLGDCYYYGTGVTKTELEAVKYYKLAAEQGDVDAQFSLGICYYYGTGVTKNEQEAVKYYKLAADQGYAEAQYRLGYCYDYGTGVTKNKKEAVKYYKLAADQGYANAQTSLGICYFSGTGVPKIEQEAVKYFKLAADQGYADAQYNLGVCFAKNTGVNKNEQEAVKYYKLAADQGNANAQNNLGGCYNKGTGVTKDEQEAVKYYKLAADQGHALAQNSLGGCYNKGTGVTKNEQEAVKYYKLAADQGHALAQNSLGMLMALESPRTSRKQ